MPDDLNSKIDKLRDEHAEQLHSDHIARIESDEQTRAFLLLGGIRAVNRVSENLNSQVMAGLLEFQRENLHEKFSFTRFADFLDQSEHSPMTKNEFYRRKELFESEGGHLYDALNASRIPIATRKLLLKNNVDMSVEGDELVIGDKRVQVGNSTAVKDLVDAVHETLRERDDRESKLQKKVDDQADKIRRGVAEFDELRRNFDELMDDSPFTKALMKCVGAAQTLVDEIKKLPEAERLQRGEDDLRIFTQQWFLLRDAYGLKIALGADTITKMDIRKNTKPVEEMTEEERKATFLDRALATIDAEGGFEDLDEEVG